MLSLAAQPLPKSIKRPERQNLFTAPVAEPRKGQRDPSASANRTHVSCSGRFLNRFERKLAQVLIVDSPNDAVENV